MNGQWVDVTPAAADDDDHRHDEMQARHKAPMERGGRPIVGSTGSESCASSNDPFTFHTRRTLLCASARKQRSLQPGRQRASPKANAAPASATTCTAPVVVSSR